MAYNWYYDQLYDERRKTENFMKYLTYKNYLEFKKNFRECAKAYDTDLDLFFTEEDFVYIFIRCIKCGVNPVQLSYHEINDIILDILIEDE